MLSKKVAQLLEENLRPETQKDFERELEIAKSKGYKVLERDYSKTVITQEQAESALEKLGIGSDSVFYQVMKRVRFFPLGAGEELNTLDQIIRYAKNSFWGDDYPGFSDKYLELSSIEGEGSYFYERATDCVYDVGWSDMDSLIEGKLAPTWNKFSDFIEWYYGDSVSRPQSE